MFESNYCTLDMTNKHCDDSQKFHRARLGQQCYGRACSTRKFYGK